MVPHSQKLLINVLAWGLLSQLVHDVHSPRYSTRLNHREQFPLFCPTHFKLSRLRSFLFIAWGTNLSVSQIYLLHNISESLRLILAQSDPSCSPPASPAARKQAASRWHSPWAAGDPDATLCSSNPPNASNATPTPASLHLSCNPLSPSQDTPDPCSQPGTGGGAQPAR